MRKTRIRKLIEDGTNLIEDAAELGGELAEVSTDAPVLGEVFKFSRLIRNTGDVVERAYHRRTLKSLVRAAESRGTNLEEVLERLDNASAEVQTLAADLLLEVADAISPQAQRLLGALFIRSQAGTGLTQAGYRLLARMLRNANGKELDELANLFSEMQSSMVGYQVSNLLKIVIAPMVGAAFPGNFYVEYCIGDNLKQAQRHKEIGNFPIHHGCRLLVDARMNSPIPEVDVYRIPFEGAELGLLYELMELFVSTQ